MHAVAHRLLMDPISWLVIGAGSLIYLVLFQVATGDLTIDLAARSLSAWVVPDWQSVMWRSRAPFQFEAVAVIEMAGVVWLASPLNLALGLVLGLLTAVQIALVRVARRCATVCGLNPATGVLAGLPGLLAGSACCAPVLLIWLGIQVTAGLVTLMGLMIPIALVLLTLGLAFTARAAARMCRTSDSGAALAVR